MSIKGKLNRFQNELILVLNIFLAKWLREKIDRSLKQPLNSNDALKGIFLSTSSK